MKRLLILAAILVCFAAEASFADSSYECDVEKVDAGKTNVLVFVNNCQLISGVSQAFPVGNGLSNDPSGSQAYLWLARDVSEVNATKHQLSMVLAALAANRRMVFRWHIDGNFAVIDYLLIK